MRHSAKLGRQQLTTNNQKPASEQREQQSERATKPAIKQPVGQLVKSVKTARPRATLTHLCLLGLCGTECSCYVVYPYVRVRVKARGNCECGKHTEMRPAVRRAVGGRLAQSKRNIAIVVVVVVAGVFVIISVGVLTVRCEYGA